jgi:hypothetical protein
MLIHGFTAVRRSSSSATSSATISTIPFTTGDLRPRPAAFCRNLNCLTCSGGPSLPCMSKRQHSLGNLGGLTRTRKMFSI